jgi:hypothetical protein
MYTPPSSGRLHQNPKTPRHSDAVRRAMTLLQRGVVERMRNAGHLSLADAAVLLVIPA